MQDVQVIDVVTGIAQTSAQALVAIAFKVLLSLLVLVIVKLVNRTIDRLLTKASQKVHPKISPLMAGFIDKVLSSVVWLLGILIVLQIWGINMAPVIAGLGITGVVLGFALQESISNIFSGLLLALNNPFGIGDYETLYAVIDYEIYSVYITADAGIGTVAVDGKVLAKTDNVFIITGLTAGSHTIDYILNSGFEGTPMITVNGTAITGNTFTLSGTDDLTVEISIYGTQPAAPSQGGSTASGDDGLGLTDYLLIILVVLIVIMAIIVALRLMRS